MKVVWIVTYLHEFLIEACITRNSIERNRISRRLSLTNAPFTPTNFQQLLVQLIVSTHKRELFRFDEITCTASNETVFRDRRFDNHYLESYMIYGYKIIHCEDTRLIPRCYHISNRLMVTFEIRLTTCRNI